MQIDNEVFTNMIQPLWAMSGKNRGVYLNLDKMERYESILLDSIMSKVKNFNQELFDAINKGGWHKQSLGIANLKHRLKNDKFVSRDVEDRGAINTRLLKVIDHWENTDFGNLSYEFHNVLADPSGNQLNNILARMSGDAAIITKNPNDPEAGRKVISTDRYDPTDSEMSTVLKHMEGRANVTIDMLVDMGFKVGINHFNNVGAQLNYLFSKNYNFQMGASMKDRWFRQMKQQYGTINNVQSLLNDVLKKAPKDIGGKVLSPEARLDRMNSLLEKENAAFDEFVQYFGQSSTWVYRPTTAEFNSMEYADRVS